MRQLFKIRRLVTVAGLALAWCALWGDIAIGTLLAGVIVAVVVTSVGVGTSYDGGINPIALARLAFLVLGDLVKSTSTVAFEILTPTDRTDEAIVAVPVSVPSRDHLFFLVSSITLTPGTAVVDTDEDECILYLHILHNNKRDEVIAHVHDAAELVCAALPVARNGVVTS